MSTAGTPAKGSFPFAKQGFEQSRTLLTEMEQTRQYSSPAGDKGRGSLLSSSLATYPLISSEDKSGGARGTVTMGVVWHAPIRGVRDYPRHENKLAQAATDNVDRYKRQQRCAT